jgi:hypothetical protein
MAETKNYKPNKNFNDITQAGLKAYDLTKKYSAVEARLTAGLLDGLVANLGKLGQLVPGAKQVRAEALSSTQAQDGALTRGYNKVTAVRQSVSRHTSNKDTQKAYGVGTRASPRLVKDVKAAIQQIVERGDGKADELSSLGLIQADIDELKAHHEAIKSADDNQELKRAGAPLTTRERNEIAHAILDAVGRIASAGANQFANEPAERKTFEDLLGAGNKKKSP